jgi:hypothetical protein
MAYFFTHSEKNANLLFEYLYLCGVMSMRNNSNFKKILLFCATAAGLTFATASNAAIFSMTDILDGTEGYFGFSEFHDQSTWRMNGSIIEDPAVLNAGGFWNSDTGTISFGFSLGGTGSVVAKGNLKKNSIVSGAITGVDGFIDMTFNGASTIADGLYRFVFEEAIFSTGGANSYDSIDNHISLWGDLGNYNATGCASNGNLNCIGVDLRLQLGGLLNQEPQPVPLPAGGILLLTALGGLVGARKAKKRKAA